MCTLQLTQLLRDAKQLSVCLTCVYAWSVFLLGAIMGYCWLQIVVFAGCVRLFDLPFLLFIICRPANQMT